MLQPKVLCSGVTHIAIAGLTIMLNGESDIGFEYNMAHLKVYRKGGIAEKQIRGKLYKTILRNMIAHVSTNEHKFSNIMC